jgi:hypothetical protein
MPATRNLKTSRSSKRKAPPRKWAPSSTSTSIPWFELLPVFVVLAAIGVSAAAWFYHQGYLLYYGDAECHLDTARRIIDSRTPGYDQLGTPWLPLPHVLMLPFAANMHLWQTGLAGAIPGVAAFVLAGTLLFAAMRRIFSSFAAGVTAALIFALNPNLLYLQATPMTEPVFFATLCGILYCTAVFKDNQSTLSIVGAGLFSICASMTRYEGWFLIPFVAAYFFIASERGRFRNALIFAAIAGAAPLYWLGDNWLIHGNPLEFYNGPYSAMGINQRALDHGMAHYPGDHDWGKAWFYFRSAAMLVVGTPVVVIGIIGAICALIKRAWWPVLLFALVPAFYTLSMYSSGTPIFIPNLWPHGYYNSRYGLAVLPLFALGGAGLVALAPHRLRGFVAAAAIAVAVLPWIAYPRTASWLVWKESQVNSDARRAWTEQAANFLRAEYRPGDGVFTMFGDMTGIFREAGIPLKETLHDGNNPAWLMAQKRPDLFLWETWAVAQSGDEVSTAMQNALKNGPRYRCVKMVSVKGAPVLEIYRREPPSAQSIP